MTVSDVTKLTLSAVGSDLSSKNSKYVSIVIAHNFFTFVLLILLSSKKHRTGKKHRTEKEKHNNNNQNNNKIARICIAPFRIPKVLYMSMGRGLVVGLKKSVHVAFTNTGS